LGCLLGLVPGAPGWPRAGRATRGAAGRAGRQYRTGHRRRTRTAVEPAGGGRPGQAPAAVGWRRLPELTPPEARR